MSLRPSHPCRSAPSAAPCPVPVAAPAACQPVGTAGELDDLVGLDLEGAQVEARLAAMTPQRMEHFYGQIGSGLSRPIVPAGLAPFMTLPGAEPRTLTRARMAAEIARAFSSTGCVTRDDLAGFTGEEIAELFTEARRIAGVDRMVA